jgi:hypothetical protein
VMSLSSHRGSIQMSKTETSRVAGRQMSQLHAITYDSKLRAE